MKKMKILKYVLLGSMILAMFAISELLYIYNNKTLLISDYLKISGFCLEHKHYSCESFFLKSASDVRFKYYKNLYSTNITQKNDFSINKQILEKYMVNKQNFIEQKMTLIYYYLGLSAYKNRDIDAALSIWEKMTYLDPDLSYVYVELANMYFRIGKFDLTKQTIERCTQFEYPKKHCQSFLETNIYNSLIEEPGFMETNIIKSISND
jgi:tetratricopeptide (TPR) repeat protein